MEKTKLKKKETAIERKQRLKDEKEKRKVHKRKISLIVVASILAVALLTTGAVYGIRCYLTSTGYFLRKQISMSTEHYEVNNAIMSFFVNDAYLSYIEKNSEYLAEYGLDTEKPLTEQYQTEGLTWRDYFIDNTRESISKMMVMAEAATANGVSLTDDEVKEIEDGIDTLDLEKYGKGITKDDAVAARKIYNLAVKFDNQTYNGLRYEEDEINEYYEENKQKYLYYDYRYYTLSYGENEEKPLTKQDAEKYAKDLAACTDEDEFVSKMKKYILLDAPDATESDIESELSDKNIVKTLYQEDDEFSKWVFEDGRKAGETMINQSEEYSNYTVFFLCKLPYKDTTATANVRHILFTTEKYGSEDAAYQKASEVLKKWELGAHTEETFAEAADKYSDDPGSNKNGGLYQNITEGEMVTSFNDWCFSPNRVPGETGIVKTDYGYHIIYYIGKGLEQWQISIYNSLVDTEYNRLCDEFTEKYPVKTDDEIMKEISF